MSDGTVQHPLLAEQGGYTSIGEEKKAGATRRNIIIAAVVAALVVVAVVLAVVFAVVLAPRKVHNDYGIIIDAGSSGSRIYVYRWPHRTNASTIPSVTPVVADALATNRFDLLLDGNTITDAVELGSSSRFAYLFATTLPHGGHLFDPLFFSLSLLVQNQARDCQG